MSSQADIELAVPYYGRRALLEEMVHSVLCQSDQSWRLLVVEDGDQGQGVGPWLESLGDDRVSHVLNPNTLGVAGNFQRCLDLTSAEWVVFPGCDDRLLPDYVASVRGAITEHAGASAVMPAVRVIDEHGRPCLPLTDRVKAWLRPSPPGLLGGEPLLSSLLAGNWTYFPATCWRRSAIAPFGFRPDLSITLDLELLGSLVLAGGTVTVTDDEVFEYRRHQQSSSSRSLVDRSRLVEERRIHDDLGARARRNGWPRAARIARVRPTSRGNALTLLPGAARDRSGVAALARHALGR